MAKRITLKNIVIVFLLAIFCFSVVRQENAIKKLSKQVSERQNKLEALEKENELLQQKVDSINTDEFAEKLARERLGLVKDGEKVVNDSNGSSSSK